MLLHLPDTLSDHQTFYRLRDACLPPYPLSDATGVHRYDHLHHRVRPRLFEGRLALFVASPFLLFLSAAAAALALAS